MKKLLIGIILTLWIGAFSALGQGWRYLAGGHLDCVKVIGQHIWAGGTDGMIWRSSDGGRTWSLTRSGRNEYFTAMAFADTTKGWVVSDPGNIYGTNDGGITWTLQYTGSARLWGVCCVDAMHAWVVGDQTTILVSRNGGGTWIPKGGWGQDNLWCVSFPDLYHGWAPGWYQNTDLWNTTDAGNSWQVQLSNVQANGVFLVDSLHGWLTNVYPGGNNNIWVTTNGGTIWSEQQLGGGLNGGIDFVDLNHGWVTGGPSGIARTTNGGANWNPENRGTPFGLRRVSFTDTSNGWAVGDGQVMTNSTDGGVTWYERKKGVTGNKCSISMVDSLNGWAGGEGKWTFTDGGLYRTRDGGNSWDTLPNSGYLYITSIVFVDTLRGWLTEGYGKRIMSTVDGGITWSVDVGTITNATSSTFPDRNHGWVTGLGGYIWAYVNGGWVIQGSGTNRDLYRVAAVDSFHAWIVGDSGTILSTTNGGGTWVSQNSGYSYQLKGVTFFDSNNGWAVGDQGIIVATTNGGSLWNPQNSGVSQPLYAVKFVNRSRGWAVGYRGTILETTNGGITWFPDSVITGYDLYDLTFTDENHGWAVGVDGITLGYGRSGTIGVGEKTEPVLNSVVQELRVESFPNPFRGTTVLRYYLPYMEPVILTVYDALGRRVRLLRNASFPGETPGEHRAVWDGRDETGKALPSGVYLLELRSEEQIKRHKLVLIR